MNVEQSSAEQRWKFEVERRKCGCVGSEICEGGEGAGEEVRVGGGQECQQLVVDCEELQAGA